MGRSILLKPNLVEDLPDPVNTNSALIGAAARCFLRLGAARIVIGEGPGHQRDTELVVQAAGLKPHLAERQIEFVDLKRDELRKVKLKANYSGLGELWLPHSVLDADFVVSIPKVKTHHWAGVMLSLKNMFGIVPGMKYGWPKNLLHWSGIHESILDICTTVPIHFVIADGITAMEGNGSLQGSARQLGRLCLPMILSRQTQPARGLWGLIHCGFGISLMGAISLATFVKIASGCWRKEWEHRRSRFPYCQSFDIFLQPRARGSSAGDRRNAGNGVP
jgi:hypothetical protein